MKIEAINQARNLLHAGHFGILGTISVKLDGFPFGSVVPYCLDGKGRPVVLISTIAQHTKNIAQDNRCSLTINISDDDVQAKGRLCIIGRMEKLPSDSEAVKASYFRYFPQAEKYGQAHDFSFYYLDPISVRYIGGFGAIYWVEPDQFLHTNPFQGKAEMRIIDHMNADHHDSLIRYLSHYKGIEVSADAQVQMVGINDLGFDLTIDKKKVRFEFEAPIEDAVQAREALVAMAKAAR